MVCKSYKYDHANTMFSKLSTLKLKDIIKYKTGIAMHKSYHNFLPDNIQTLLSTRKSHYNTRISYNNRNLLKCCVPTNIRQMSISYRGSNVWNKLYPEVKCATTVSDIKNNIYIKITSQLHKRITKIQSVIKIKLAALCA